MIFLIAIIFTILGLFGSVSVDKNTGWYIVAGIINFAVGLFFAYFALPHLYWLSYETYLWGLAFILINAIISGVADDVWPIGGTIFLICFGFGLLILIAGTPLIDSSRYRDMIGEIKESDWKQDMHPLDESHVRLVPRQTAEFQGNKVIGDAEGALGSRYRMGKYVIQKVRGEQYWVAPLEFIDFWKWRRFEYSPGFVMVSAEDPSRKPEIFLDYKMKYLLSSCFSKNLKRRLYNMGYATNGLTDYTFELDDEEVPNPWYVITIHHPKTGFLLQEVDGVVVISPETGELHPETPSRGYFNPDEAPAWVDRIYPEEYVENYIEWSGKYVHGIWNFSNRDVEVPTAYGGDSNGVWLTFGDGGGQNWFTGMTSVSSEDQSLTCFVLVDSRTGSARKYRLSGSNEEGVRDAVNSEFSNFNGQYVATQPILRNINGKLAWVCPVITIDKGILKRITIINPENLEVYKGEDFREAISEYEMSLTGTGFDVALTNKANLKQLESGIIQRWNPVTRKNTLVYYFMVKEVPGKIFMVTENTSSEVLVTKEKDGVSMSYVETSKSIVPVKIFDNLSIEVQKAEIQEQLETRRDSVEEQVDQRGEAKDFLKDVKAMSPEELLKLKEAMKN